MKHKVKLKGLEGRILFHLFVIAIMMFFCADIRAEEGQAEVKEGEQEQNSLAEGSKEEKKKILLSQAEPAEEVTQEARELEEIVVIERKPVSAASSKEVRERDFELLPKNKPSDLLRVAPGLITLQHQGGGKADQFLLRGFNSDHGTDIALFVDKLPVNLRSHAHGQGYSDLHFVIPETIETVEVFKGPYFTEFGDFANSGAVRLITKDFVPESFVQASSGLYAVDRFRPIARGLTLFSPIVSDNVKTLGAFEIIYDDGPFINENNFFRINGFGKLTWNLTDNSRLSFWGSAYYGDWDASGQIPLRAVESGLIDRFDAIDPTEGGETERYNAHLTYSLIPDEKSEFISSFFFSCYKLDLFSNFTFFLNDPINGDGIVQRDNRYLYGTDTRYNRFFALFGRDHLATGGLQVRADHNDLVLGNQTRREQTFTVNDVDIFEISVSPFIEAELNLTDWARAVLGVRRDIFRFDTDGISNIDNDPNVPEPEPLDGEETDSIVSYKASLILNPVKNTEFFLNFGTGFHSNDARVVVLGSSVTQQLGSSEAALPRSIGSEIGARTRLLDNRLDLAGAFWYLFVEEEFVFVGDDGTFEPIGSTRRFGGEIEGRLALWGDWLFLHGDLNITDAKFTDPVDIDGNGTGDGDEIPLAPEIVSRSGLAVRTPFGLEGALEVLYIGDRPSEETGDEEEAEGFTRVDLTLRYRYKNLETFAIVENLFDSDYRDAQNFFESRLPGEPAEGVGDIHFTPGNPFAFRIGLTYYLTGLFGGTNL